MAEKGDFKRTVIKDLFTDVLLDFATFFGLDWVIRRGRQTQEGKKPEELFKVPGVIIDVCTTKDSHGNETIDKVRLNNLDDWIRRIGNYRRSLLESLSREDIKKILLLPEQEREKLLESAFPPSPWEGLKKSFQVVKDFFLKDDIPETQERIERWGQWATTQRAELHARREAAKFLPNPLWRLLIKAIVLIAFLWNGVRYALRGIFQSYRRMTWRELWEAIKRFLTA